MNSVVLSRAAYEEAGDDGMFLATSFSPHVCDHANTLKPPSGGPCGVCYCCHVVLEVVEKTSEAVDC